MKALSMNGNVRGDRREILGMSLEELEKENSTKSQVNGHEGWKYTENGLHYFGYVHNDKGILVGVTNETRLYEIIV